MSWLRVATAVLTCRFGVARSTLRRNSAKRITAVIPYYGYKRDVGKPESEIFAQEATHEHGRGHGSAIPISAADVALMLETMVSVHCGRVWCSLSVSSRCVRQGVDRVISVDLQPPGHGQIQVRILPRVAPRVGTASLPHLTLSSCQGFFPSHVAVDSLRSVGLAVAYFAKQSLRNVVVVSPNEACMQLACDLQVRPQQACAGRVSVRVFSLRRRCCCVVIVGPPLQTGLMRASAKGRAAFGLREVGLAALVQGGHSRGMDRYAVKGDASETTLLGDVKVGLLVPGGYCRAKTDDKRVCMCRAPM